MVEHILTPGWSEPDHGPPMDEAEPDPTVELIVTTADLVRAIGQLAIHFPQRLHVEAWRVMTAELLKRELGVPAKPIVLAQRSYDEFAVQRAGCVPRYGAVKASES